MPITWQSSAKARRASNKRSHLYRVIGTSLFGFLRPGRTNEGTPVYFWVKRDKRVPIVKVIDGFTFELHPITGLRIFGHKWPGHAELLEYQKTHSPEEFAIRQQIWHLRYNKAKKKAWEKWEDYIANLDMEGKLWPRT